jgi:alcohol dehydrogenase (cytochrome c)
MIRFFFFFMSFVFGAAAPMLMAQVKNFEPVTQQMLVEPSPDDWLMYSRTYDAQRFSPLKQINRQNVSQLRMVWTRGMAPGTTENIPIVYRGNLYVINGGNAVQALDATTGDLIWEYQPKTAKPQTTRRTSTNTIAISDELIFFSPSDGSLAALSAQTGELRWELPAGEGQQTSGPLVVEGKVITAHSGTLSRSDCFISAHEAKSGKELWKFYTAPAAGEPGGDSWGDVALEKRLVSSWGLPGTYDPVRKLVYWGIANPMPTSRIERHGSPDSIPHSAPADLYSNSTVALNPETGKLAWYYQHLPGDDWGKDQNYERILVQTPLNPDRKFVRWVNPKIPRGEVRDVAISVGDPGGMWALDRATGQFLWATPFPYKIPEFYLSKIDVETGKTFLNEDLLFSKPGERHLVCFFNSRGNWPTAYHPGTNSLYVPYIDSCLDMIQGGRRVSAPPPGSEQAGANRSLRELNALPEAISFTALARVNVATGEIVRFDTGQAPGNGAILATGGDLIFWGDLNRRFKAFDADTGKLLWESILGGTVSTSTITYAVGGKQYVAVMTGDTPAMTVLLQKTPRFKPPLGHTAIYVFALPDQR